MRNSPSSLLACASAVPACAILPRGRVALRRSPRAGDEAAAGRSQPSLMVAAGTSLPHTAAAQAPNRAATWVASLPSSVAARRAGRCRSRRGGLCGCATFLQCGRAVGALSGRGTGVRRHTAPPRSRVLVRFFCLYQNAAVGLLSFFARNAAAGRFGGSRVGIFWYFLSSSSGQVTEETVETNGSAK
jgi:hypothetical protein